MRSYCCLHPLLVQTIDEFLNDWLCFRIKEMCITSEKITNAISLQFLKQVRVTFCTEAETKTQVASFSYPKWFSQGTQHRQGHKPLEHAYIFLLLQLHYVIMKIGGRFHPIKLQLGILSSGSKTRFSTLAKCFLAPLSKLTRWLYNNFIVIYIYQSFTRVVL